LLTKEASRQDCTGADRTHGQRRAWSVKDRASPRAGPDALAAATLSDAADVALDVMGARAAIQLAQPDPDLRRDGDLR
jgi:hypothetical protein